MSGMSLFGKAQFTTKRTTIKFRNTNDALAFMLQCKMCMSEYINDLHDLLF